MLGRSALASSRLSSAASGGGRGGCHSRKRSLPVSGWEELIEEAAADLEQVGWEGMCVSWVMAVGGLMSSLHEEKALHVVERRWLDPLAFPYPSPVPACSSSAWCTRQPCAWWSCRGGVCSWRRSWWMVARGRPSRKGKRQPRGSKWR